MGFSRQEYWSGVPKPLRKFKKKAILKSMGWIERAFTWPTRASGEISTFQAQTHDPSSTARGLAQKPPSLRQINKPSSLRLILGLFRPGLLKHLPASQAPTGPVRSEQGPENLHFYQFPDDAPGPGAMLGKPPIWMIRFSGATHGATDIQLLDCSPDVQSLSVCFLLYFPCWEPHLQNDT